MGTTRWLRVSIASLLLLPAAAQEPAPEGQPPAPPRLVVPAGEPPVLDGRVDGAEWKSDGAFPIMRGPDKLGSGRVRRSGRQLYLAFDSAYSPWALGLRFTFTDPLSQRAIILLVTPLHPPKPPVSAFRSLAGREPEAISCTACDLHFAFAENGGFSCEVRVPLDLLEFAAIDKEYAFAAEMWDLDADRPIAVFPHALAGPLAVVAPAMLASEGAWGATEVPGASPPPSEAIELLESLGREEGGGAPLFLHYTGWAGGQRRDAPLARLEESAVRLLAAHPDWVSLHALLVQTRYARNDVAGALAALDRLGEAFPVMGASPSHLLIRFQMLRELGRYEEALAHLDRNAETLAQDPSVPRERTILAALLEEWRIEREIRAEEAARDDLPRVRLRTTKGEILLELFEDDVPNGVANFVSLVDAGLYDGTRFHWVEGARRVLGGDPNSKDADPSNDGFGDPGYLIESEPGRRMSFPYTVSYVDKRRTRRTHGCAFAIQIGNLVVAEPRESVFGRVVAGEDVVRRLEYGDAIEKAEVVRRRPHPYQPVKRP